VNHKEMAEPLAQTAQHNGAQYFQGSRGCQPNGVDMVYKDANWAQRALTRVQTLLLPPTCVACSGRAESLDLCQACRDELPINRLACKRCAIPLQGAGAELCGACLRRAPHYEVSYCAFRYAYPIEHFIKALKYGHAIAHARVLGTLLAQYLKQRHEHEWPSCLIPVPLASKRYRERGYNQVIELGRLVEKQLRIPMRTDLLTRSRHTAEQAGLSRKERRKNLRRAFTVTAEVPKHVAVLDDVITTGSTANEVARTLKRAGAQRVEVWAVARVELR